MKLHARTLALLLMMLVLPASAQILPTGFVDDLVVGGFSLPIGIDHLPDGRVLVIEEFSAGVWVVAGNTKALVGTVPNVRTVNSEGLMGIAVDPQWPTRPYVYVLFSYDLTNDLHVSRFEITGDLTNPTSTNLVLGGEYKILTDIPDVHAGHNGGTVRFSADGMLYVSLGEDEFACTAQDPSVLGGCILRLDVASLPTGTGGPPAKSAIAPPNNPLAGQGDNEQLIWCEGLRNPFRFHADEITGDLFIADVGSNLFEEINVSSTGGENFGWPWFEGTQSVLPCGPTTPAVVDPVAVLDRATVASPVSAIASLSVYRSTGTPTWDFGPSYQGDLFYLDYYIGHIRRLTHNGTQWVPATPVAGQPSPDDWATGYGFVADGSVGPDGGIYYIRQAPGELRVIHPDPNALQINIVGGNNQIANADQPLLNPIVAQVTTATGTPVAGVPVTFAEAFGIGTFGPQPVVTDANGMASTSYHVGLSVPTITVTAPGAASTTVSLTWRGLIGASTPGGLNYMFLWLLHSLPNTPFSLAVEPPQLASAIPSPAGPIWTTILNPGPFLIVADGLGLVGPPGPYYTDASGSWQHTLWNPPASISGLTVVCQAYSVDGTQPFPLNFLVTNRVFLTFP